MLCCRRRPAALATVAFATRGIQSGADGGKYLFGRVEVGGRGIDALSRESRGEVGYFSG